MASCCRYTLAARFNKAGGHGFIYISSGIKRDYNKKDISMLVLGQDILGLIGKRAE